MESIDDVRFAPTQMQEYVEKKVELRVPLWVKKYLRVKFILRIVKKQRLIGEL